MRHGGHLVIVYALPAGRNGNQAERQAGAISAVLAALPAELPAGVTYEVRVVAGRAGVALAATAERNGATAVVIGAPDHITPTESEGIPGAVAARTRIPVEVVAARPGAAV